MITDLGLWTIIINLIAIAFAVQYSNAKSFRDSLLCWVIWELTGLRFVWEKIKPPPDEKPENYRPPATIAVWTFGLFSLYTALYGLASQRYENAVDKIENRMNSYITQLSALTNQKLAGGSFREVRRIQEMQCPVPPILLKPDTAILSLFRNDAYGEAKNVLIRTVENHRNRLEGADLEKVNLEGADLAGGNLKDADLKDAILKGAELDKTILEKADLWGANLEKSNFWEANLQGAHMTDANLKSTILQDANLKGASLEKVNLESAYMKDANLVDADLREANLQGATMWATNLTGASLEKANLESAHLWEANLQGTNLRNAKGLTPKQLCSVKTLFQAILDKNLEAQVRQLCPEKLE